MDFQSVAHLTLIQILEKLSKVILVKKKLNKNINLKNVLNTEKIQEFSSNLNRSEEYNSLSTELLNAIISYFIKTNDSTTENSELQEKHNFYICSILIRRVCSPNLTKLNTEEQLEYFKLLFKYSMKYHKDKMKKIENLYEKIIINTFHIDFIKICVYYSASLIEKHDLKLKPVKLCKQLVDLLTNLNDKFEFEVNYYNQFKLNKITDSNEVDLNEDEENSLGSVERLKIVLIKTLGLSARKLDIDDFVSLLEYLETVASVGSTQTLIRLTEFIRFISCEIELNDELKAKLSEFIQKLLIQLQPFYISLKLNNQIDDIISLFNCQTSISASKYVNKLFKFFISLL